MQIWKLILAGITGDLAKKKILPAIAQLAEKYNTEVQIHLIGYSRSQPDQLEIKRILNQATTSGSHKLSQIEYYQGNYDKPTLITDFSDNLHQDERLIVYLAVPPLTYSDILKNATGLEEKQVSIIIEKPFGRDLEEASKLVEIIKTNGLENKVHFFDHYLFKNATIITKADKSNLNFLKEKKLTSIKINALELEDAKNRGGYYNTIGALKDMWPHIYNLTKLVSENIPKSNPHIEIEKFSFQWHKIVLGQYKSYTHDIQVDSSNTETFFDLVGSIKFSESTKEDKPGKKLKEPSIPIKIVSGKKLNLKETSISLTFEELLGKKKTDHILKDSTTLFWSIYPNPSLQVTSQDSNFVINLEKNNNLDHTNLFLDLIENNNQRFTDIETIGKIWKSYEQIVQSYQNQNSKLEIYTARNWEFL